MANKTGNWTQKQHYHNFQIYIILNNTKRNKTHKPLSLNKSRAQPIHLFEVHFLRISASTTKWNTKNLKKIQNLAHPYYTFQKKQTKLSIANLVKGERSINLLVGYTLNRANFPSILITRNHHRRVDPQLIITQWPKISKIQNTKKIKNPKSKPNQT